MKHLNISPDLALPIDAATQTFAFIARKGAGKTYAAGKTVEELLRAGVQVVILDAVGNWYGLRIAADGKAQGFDIPVIGGLRGDLPLQATAGELIADVLVETARSMILDISQFSLADRKRFATAFGERLWKQKKAESHPTPLMLVIEESQLIVPQFSKGAEQMLGIYEEIIRLGRNYGIGVMMISQRPQSVNKEVLNQTECLFVGQVNGAQERDALKKWITHQGMDVHLVDELPHLKVGEFYVWSPQWLGILQKISIGKKQTFDASATPKVGDKTVRRDPSPLDLGELESRMAQTLEQAKQNDPRELRRQIIELKRQLQQQATARPVQIEKEIERVEVPVLNGELPKLQSLIGDLRDALAPLNQLPQVIAPLTDTLNAVSVKVELVANAPKQFTAKSIAASTHNFTLNTSKGNKFTLNAAPSKMRLVNAANDDLKLRAGERKILQVLAQYHPTRLTNAQVGTLTRFPSTGKTFATYSGVLKRNGLIVEYPNGLEITEKGFAVVGDVPEKPQSAQELFEQWSAVLRSGERQILQVLMKAHPHSMTLETLLTHLHGDFTDKTIQTYIGVLRRNELIEVHGDILQASDALFMG